MFLQEPDQSQFDLRFSVFGIPVRVHPFFWLVSIILGWSAMRDGGPEGFLYLGIWVACVFVSVLIHELGHVTMGQAFGSDGHIVLYSFGGLAVGSSNLSERWQRILVMVAGPGAGFLFLGIVLTLGTFYDSGLILRLVGSLIGERWGVIEQVPPMWVVNLLVDLIWINFFWGMINLLPIWPLDGGQVSREVFQQFARQNAIRNSLILSIVVSLFFAFNALMGAIRKEPFIPYLPQGDWFTVIFFSLFAVGSWQILQQTPSGGSSGGYRMVDESYQRAPWERDSDWWKRG